MKQLKICIVLLLLSTSIFGCAKLRIDTAVYNGPMPVSLEEANKLIIEIQHDETGLFNPKVSNQEEALFNSNKLKKSDKSKIINLTQIRSDHLLLKDPTKSQQDIAKEADEFAEKEWKDTIEPAFAKKEIEKIWEKNAKVSYTQTEEALGKLIKSINKIPEASQYLTPAATSNYYHLLSKKHSFNKNYRLFIEALTDFWDDAISTNSQDYLLLRITPTYHTAGVSNNDQTFGRIIGSPVFANYIKTIPNDEPFWKFWADDDKYWTKFNTNYFNAWGGDAQFVAIGKGLIEFRQKSLDFDPTSAISAGSALSIAGLQVAAALATGQIALPVAKTDSGTDTNSFSSGNGVTLNQAKLNSNKDLLKRRSMATRDYITSLATLVERISQDRQPRANELALLRKELRSLTAFFEARLDLDQAN